MSPLIRRTLLLAALLFPAVLLAPLAGAAAVGLPSVGTCAPVVVGTVCVDASPTCPAAWYVPPFTDFGAGARHCPSGTVSRDTVTACDLVVAGFWTLGGFTGVNEQACVTFSQYPGSPTCVAASGRAWDVRPICLP